MGGQWAGLFPLSPCGLSRPKPWLARPGEAQPGHCPADTLGVLRGVRPIRRCCWYLTGPYSMADSFVLSSMRSLTTRSETGRPSLISCSSTCKY
jgi:hypothetical protein